MPNHDVEIEAAEGGRFDTYVSLPETGSGPGVVLMASVFGVDDDLRRIADRLAAEGFAVAAPDVFWRGDKGPLDRSEDGQARAKARGQNRAAIIEAGVQDLADTMAYLRTRPECNGRIAVIGFCYGGPYAILGPARLGCDAGISFHGTVVENYLGELDKVRAPLSLHWGDEDHACPPETLTRIRAATAGRSDVDIVVYPGVGHGYTAETSAAYDAEATGASLARAIEVINGLRTPKRAMASAS